MMHVKKRYDIAVFLLKPIFDKNPGNVAVGKLLVKCYLQQDKYKEALDIFDALSDKLGDNPSLLLSKIDMFDIPDSMAAKAALIALSVIIATISVTSGVDKGIRVLSELNVALALGLILFVLFMGWRA